ncbi:MAG: hypothetical protein ABIZ04_02790 [Opitutus sp.]
MSELKIDLEYPAIKEMLARRSDGNPDYVAGVRAYLMQGEEPLSGTVACQGYWDAHDMTEYLSATLADLRADMLEEEARLLFFRKKSICESPSPLQKSAEVSNRAVGIKPNRGQCIRI